jgi:hypothetical protein
MHFGEMERQVSQAEQRTARERQRSGSKDRQGQRDNVNIGREAQVDNEGGRAGTSSALLFR